jgi:AhpD family alkylhydroperoxidase
MSDDYHQHSDVRLLKDMRRLAPKEYEAWFALNAMISREDGAIPRKYRELIAIAVSTTTQCPYCIEAHAKAAKAAGATREEVAEASLLAAALRAGGSAMHGTLALKFFDQ